MKKGHNRYNNYYHKYKKNIDYYRVKLEKRVNKKLIKRYDHPLYYHDIKMINDIIYNEKTHYVEVFKEYLIYEDINEFLRRFYNKEDIYHRLPKILIFYEKYSKIYANYTVIPESKYMYKNIKRKQKMIDQIQNCNANNNDNSECKEKENNIIFTTNAMNSINSFTMSIYTNQSLNNNTKSDSGIKDLVMKINNFEKQAEMIKNKINKLNFKNSNLNYQKEIKKKQNLIYGKGMNKVISALFSPNSKSKLIEKNKNNVNTNNSKNSKKKLSIGDSSKSDKIILSTNVSLSPKLLNEKMFSSPSSKKDILKKTNNYLSPSISINHSRKNSQQINKVLYNSKGKKIPETQRNNINYNINIFPYKNDNLKPKLGKNYNLNQNKLNNIVNNYNIINNFQEGITQINIYTNNETLKTIKLNNGNSAINNTNNYKRISNSTGININNNNNTYNVNKDKNLYKYNNDKFDLNLRKIIHNNMIEESSSSNKKSLQKDFFHKIGKYFHVHNLSKNESNINSTIALNKISINESKNFSNEIIKSQINHKKNIQDKNGNNLKNKNLKSPNASRGLSPNNSNFSTLNVRRIGTNTINLGDKYKLNNQNFNKYSNKINEDFMIHSERNKKSKITFK